MLKEEMETVIRYDAVDDCWHVWSCVPKHIKAMKKKGWTLISEDNNGFATFVAPVHSIKYSNAQKPQKRRLSDEEKLELTKRFTATSDT